MKKILILKTEGEALRMRSFLESENIPFVIKSFGDTAYSSVFQNQDGWGRLEAPEEFEEKIKDFYLSEAVLPDEVGEGVQVNENKRGFGKYWLAIIFLALLSGTLGWLYYDVNKKYQGVLYNEITYSAWSSNNEVLVSRWKKSDKIAYLNNDRDFNYNFESVEYYDTSGRYVSTWYDTNKDGLLDQEIVFSGKDTIRTISSDLNDDNLLDETKIMLPEKFSLSIRDTNFDIAYDEIVLWDESNNSLGKYTMEEFLAILKSKK